LVHLNNKRGKILIWFFIGLFSPILTLIIKPKNYGLYIVNHTLPNTLIGKMQMIISESILIIGFILALITSFFLFRQGMKRKYLLLLCPLLVLANPLQQVLYLEPLDTYLNNQLWDKAKEHHVIGMNLKQVVKIFGNPDNVRMHGAQNRIWEYKPLPGYWMGSHFQIFFIDEKVTGYEANDD
jgi:hypothetical protein